jgi:hypothetical protein
VRPGLAAVITAAAGVVGAGATIYTLHHRFW